MPASMAASASNALDVVAGQDRDRPLRRKLAVEQRLRDAAHLR
jgi:hypothetical protein